MRRLAVLCLSLAILAIPAVAAAYVRSDDDGTVNVRNGVGAVWLGARAPLFGRYALFGRFDKGTLKVVTPADGDQPDVSVWGDPTVSFPTDTTTTTLYTGTNLRFRIVGRFRAMIKGSDVDLAAVGQGRVGLRGTDGTYAFNGGLRRALPATDDLTLFDLNANTAAEAGP